MTDQAVARERAGDLLSQDPPEHTRLRRFLSPAFTVRQVDRLRPRIERIVDDALDRMEHAGPPADLVPVFALPIPSLVISELLGVPDGDLPRFRRLAGRTLDPTLPPHDRTAAFRGIRAYLADLAARPGPGLLGVLARDHGDELTTDERAAIGHLMLLAGYETTANMLALGTLALLRHPEQGRAVRERPDRVDAAVEELLRWLSVVTTATPRITTGTVELAGRRIEAGSWCWCRCPPRTATRRWSPTPRSSTRPAARPATSPSATACTTASARRWPGRSCASRSRPCCAASRTCGAGWREHRPRRDRSATVPGAVRGCAVIRVVASVRNAASPAPSGHLVRRGSG